MHRFGKTAVASLAALVLLSGLAVFSTPASAHVPIYESGGPSMATALPIPDPSVSYATYAEFKEDRLTETQFYSIDVSAGHNQYIELDVPSEYRMFTPILILIGPGLAGPDESTSYLLSRLELNLTSGYGAKSWNFSGPLDEEEFEPFTQVTLLKRQSLNVTLPESGIYYIAVARVIDTHGLALIAVMDAKYILVTGTEEKFTIVDYVLIPYDWVKGHLFWNENPLIFLLPTYLITLGGLLFLLYMRRTHPTSSAVGPQRAGQAVFYAALGGGLLMAAGGVNQLLYLFGNPLFTLGVGETIVMMLQGIGIVLGIVAIRLSFSLVKPAKLRRLAVSAIIFVSALIVGAGFIIGPIAFIAAAATSTYMSRPKMIR